ncbi:MAG TPA: DUF3606 domain-containing protein [Bacteroidia bacterium]|jgi:hypothetical protein
MPDNKSKQNAQDSGRINIHEEYEVRYWTEKFGCTKAQLVEAVNRVGTSSEKVGEFLSRK